MSTEQTKQLNSTIDAKLVAQLEQLKEKTKVPKKALIEEAIRLLLQQHRSLTAVYKNGVADNQFIAMVDEKMKQYDQTMRKLAE